MSSFTPNTIQVRTTYITEGAHLPAAKAYDHAEASAEFNRWLNRVKAEAAREALTQYASEFEGEGSEWIGPMGPTLIARDVRNFITEHYPEEQK